MQQVALRVLARNSPRSLAEVVLTLGHRRATVVAVCSHITEDHEQIAIRLVLELPGVGELERLTQWLLRIVDVLAVEPVPVGPAQHRDCYPASR
jgi:acetolactate synthase small subunit